MCIRDRNIIHGKRLKILLPVIDPVLVLCFAFRNIAGTGVRKQPDFLQLFFHQPQRLSDVISIVQIKADPRGAVVRPQVRQNINKHAFCFFFRQRHMILNFNSLDADLIQLLSLIHIFYSLFLHNLFNS